MFTDSAKKFLRGTIPWADMGSPVSSMRAETLRGTERTTAIPGVEQKSPTLALKIIHFCRANTSMTNINFWYVIPRCWEGRRIRCDRYVARSHELAPGSGGNTCQRSKMLQKVIAVLVSTRNGLLCTGDLNYNGNWNALNGRHEFRTRGEHQFVVCTSFFGCLQWNNSATRYSITKNLIILQLKTKHAHQFFQIMTRRENLSLGA